MQRLDRAIRSRNYGAHPIILLRPDNGFLKDMESTDSSFALGVPENKPWAKKCWMSNVVSRGDIFGRIEQ